MGTQHAQPASSNLPTRRGLREAEKARLTPARGTPALIPGAAPSTSAPRSGRGAVRAGILVALVGITIVVPMTQGTIPGTVADAGTSVDGELPGTVEALTAMPLSILPPASLITTDALEARSTLTASRSEDRDPLPGCDSGARPAGSNGTLSANDLCTLWDGRTQLRADAAVSFAVLNEAFVARFGTDLCLSSGYRTMAQQRAVKVEKGFLAAAPGKSNHGWGLAIDLCGTETSGARWTWLNKNANTYGWENPAWARPGGSGPFERWHWEYTQGVQDDGEYYG